MKAYIVQDRGNYCEYVVVAFAETRGKAIMEALGSDAYPHSDWSFIEMTARRVPALDKAYRGVPVMDWYNPEDRIAMVRDADIYCNKDIALDYGECPECPAKDYCESYPYFIAMMKEKESTKYDTMDKSESSAETD